MILNKATVCVVCSLLAGSVQAQQRQYGGSDVYISNYPFVVAIGYGSDLVGNGAILAPKWIVSSASSFYTTPDVYYRIYVGGDSYPDGEKYISERIFRHSEFVGWDYNIALMRLNRKIRFGPTIKPILLPRTDIDAVDVTLLSYGRNEQGSKHLKAAPHFLASDDNCIQKLTDVLTKEVIRSRHGYCMYPAKGAKTGQWANDAGAPAVAGNVLYGLFALGEHDGGYTNVSVVTRVAFFKDWINEKMGK